MSSGLLAFTLFHTAISLVVIVAGFVVVWGFIASRRSFLAGLGYSPASFRILRRVRSSSQN